MLHSPSSALLQKAWRRCLCWATALSLPRSTVPAFPPYEDRPKVLLLSVAPTRKWPPSSVRLLFGPLSIGRRAAKSDYRGAPARAGESHTPSCGTDCLATLSWAASTPECPARVRPANPPLGLWRNAICLGKGTLVLAAFRSFFKGHSSSDRVPRNRYVAHSSGQRLHLASWLRHVSEQESRDSALCVVLLPSAESPIPQGYKQCPSEPRHTRNAWTTSSSRK